jgi:hypothetical protein
VGAGEAALAGAVEALVKYHPGRCAGLTPGPQAGGGTLAGGQFDWGGRLLKGNGGAQRFPQAGWTSAVACNGTRELDCEAARPSRDESRA